MKFEDLKLPDWSGPFQAVALDTARAVYDQMHAHYEAKLEPPKPEPEELFEHPDMPGKKFRRLTVGEVRESGDFACSKNPNSVWVACITQGYAVEVNEGCHYYREVPKPLPEWRLPDPPSGQQWHRTDWTQDMLPDGYRPLLLGEPWVAGDEIWRSDYYGWQIAGHKENDILDTPTEAKACHCRTRRPLPTPVEYVPLEPGDVPPGSAIRQVGNAGWDIVCSVGANNIWIQGNGFSWAYLMRSFEILRPGSTNWEPCKKPKP